MNRDHRRETPEKNNTRRSNIATARIKTERSPHRENLAAKAQEEQPDAPRKRKTAEENNPKYRHLLQTSSRKQKT